MIYTIIGGIVIGIILSIFVVGFMCIMLIAGENDHHRKPKKGKK